MILNIKFILIFYIIAYAESLPALPGIPAIDLSFDVTNCFKRQCFEELGCFSTQSFVEEVKKLLTSGDVVSSIKSATALKQILSICPIHPEAMNATLLLFTPTSNKTQWFDAYKTDMDQFKASDYSPQRPTAFIVHGYTDYYEECDGQGMCAWMAHIKNYFLSQKYNVIAVDWKSPASSINYFNSAFNTQIVGAIVARFIEKLMETSGTDPYDIHLVGHSLGAQICGFTGKNLQLITNGTLKVGHITGLDPAGPGFTGKRLSPEDANLVTVIHTSAGVTKNTNPFSGENPLESVQLFGFLGCSDSLAHFDFWPNGGSGQRGCEKISAEFLNEIATSGFNALAQKAKCDHSRATELPTYELEERQPDSCQMIGYQCESYGDFSAGKCADCGPDNERCRPMEFWPQYWPKRIDTPTKLSLNELYLLTASKDPFCLFHYQIVILMEETSVAGTFSLSLNTVKPVVAEIESDLFGFKSGQNYTYLYTDSQHLGQIAEVMVSFEENIAGQLSSFGQNFNPFAPKAVTNDPKITMISINFMSNFDKSIRDKYSSRLYPDAETPTTFHIKTNA